MKLQSLQMNPVIKFDLYDSQSLAGLGCWWSDPPLPATCQSLTWCFPKVLACLLWWWRWWWWLIWKQSLGSLNWGCEDVNKWINSSMWMKRALATVLSSSRILLSFGGGFCDKVCDLVLSFVFLKYSNNNIRVFGTIFLNP